MNRLKSLHASRAAIHYAAMLVLLLCGSRLSAQNWNANIEGTILDPRGSPVSSASVRLTSPATGLVRKGSTDADGHYSLPLLPVGTYDLEVGKRGFSTAKFSGITLQVGQTVRLNLTLKLSRAQTSVQVETQSPLVETASPALGDEIDNRRVSLLPLNGRQFSQLTLLAAGAIPPYANGATQQFNTAAQGIGFSVDGQRSERNNFSLDGVSIMEPFAYSISVNPSIDAIREFHVLENSYSTEQGVTSGAQVNIATRAGTNRFSGTVYEYLRNSALDARNFFDDPARAIPPFRQNQFGASLGGPIQPDRTFFFGNYEGYRVRQSVTNTTLLPTAAQRQGDFGGINPLTGQPFSTIIDPATGQAFSGNQIPASRIDPLSAAVLARLPLPNLPGAAAGSNNNINVGRRNVYTDQFTLRLDHQFTEREQVFARALIFNSRQLFPFVPNAFAQNPSAPPGFGTNKNDTGRNFALGLTSVLSSSLVNDFRFGYAHYLGSKEAQNINRGFLESLSISRAPGATNRGIPAINVPGYADMGDSDIFQPQIRKDNTFQFTDNLAWVHGRHTLKMGADFRVLRLSYRVEDFGQGIFSFSDGFGSVSGTAFSDFLLGRPFLSFAQAGNSGGNDHLNYFGAYVSDEFRATPRLTFTYGLREEFYTSPTNADGRASILDPSDANRYIVLDNHGQAQNLLADPLIQKLRQNFGLEFTTSEQAGLPASLIRPDYAGWAPRLGFAYDLAGHGKDSLRGGLGVFNSLGELDYTAETRLSAPITEFLFGLDLCRFYGPGACGQPYAPPQLSYSLAYQLGNAPPDSISSPPNIRNGYVYEWSLSLDHQLSPSTVLSISYAGSDGHKLPRRALQNQGVPNQPGIRLGYHPQPGSDQFVRATDVNSNYHAMIVRLERRYSRGFSFVAGYTFGKSLDTASGLQGTNQPQDNYNLKAERGLSDFDVRQRFVLSNNWEIPLGKDRRWARSGAAATLLGNWEISGIFTLQSGQPLTAILSTALSGTQSNGTDRPDLVGNPNLSGARRDPARWFNTAAFQPPPVYFDAQGAFSIPGNEGRNVITGPGLVGTDLSLERHARLGVLGEKANIVLRGDFFNLANHPNFDRPGLILGTSNFARISSAENSRQIQLSLRLDW
ncbi:MAG TPA: carboxypeptidase regulatory-like domain-containing protein [Terriglobia bacterium]|nr:carboxypeptidase regulatory-like domain-containing protein [Terriglobia bacterium]